MTRLLSGDRPTESGYVLVEDVRYVQRPVRPRRRLAWVDEVVDPWSYHAKRGLGTLRLTVIEYRILQYLAARPNQACTPRRIVEAVSTRRHPLTVQTLGRHIHSLRGQLGFFSDYIQTVPYIGYRFKE
jgi:DNA-binding response OmpR family regulator